MLQRGLNGDVSHLLYSSIPMLLRSTAEPLHVRDTRCVLYALNRKKLIRVRRISTAVARLHPATECSHCCDGVVLLRVCFVFQPIT